MVNPAESLDLLKNLVDGVSVLWVEGYFFYCVKFIVQKVPAFEDTSEAPSSEHLHFLEVHFILGELLIINYLFKVKAVVFLCVKRDLFLDFLLFIEFLYIWKLLSFLENMLRLVAQSGEAYLLAIREAAFQLALFHWFLEVDKILNRNHSLKKTEGNWVD